jgi:pantoate--beta-alanine ligase
MVRDLDIPVRIELCPTVREPDGLAMSSRNVRLSGRDRARADALHRALDALAQSIAAGERDPVVARGRALAQLAADGLEPDYLELVSADTLTPLERIDGHPILALIAARVGDTRLIDNELIQPLPSAEAAGATKPHPTAEAAGATKPLPTAQAAGATNDGSP